MDVTLCLRLHMCLSVQYAMRLYAMRVAILMYNSMEEGYPCDSQPIIVASGGKIGKLKFDM